MSVHSIPGRFTHELSQPLRVRPCGCGSSTMLLVLGAKLHKHGDWGFYLTSDGQEVCLDEGQEETLRVIDEPNLEFDG